MSQDKHQNVLSAQFRPQAPGSPSAPAAAGTYVPRSSRPSRQEAIAGLSPAVSGVEWYWEAVSPSYTDIEGSSLDRALAGLLEAPEGQNIDPPSTQAMAALVDLYGIQILAETQGYNVSPALVLAVISVESAGRSDAVSSAGAEGLMQLMPFTAERFNVEDSFDPVQNISGGTAYLDWLLSEFEGRAIFALAGYNAGEGAVRSYEGVPPYSETRAYVPKVLAAWQVARRFCVTPPTDFTAPCELILR